MQKLYRRLLMIYLLITFVIIEGYAQPSKIVVPSRDSESLYPWLTQEQWKQHVQNQSLLGIRIATPAGATRTNIQVGSFAYWLRYLPLYKESRLVHLYDQGLKDRQDVHVAVIDIDVGKRDLQQCADAAIRLRAEYLYSMQKWNSIRFNFTTGDQVSWQRWAKGERVYVKETKVNGKRRWNVYWKKKSKRSYSYQNFKKYLRKIFTYAGTASLSRELKSRASKEIQIGDLYVQGGFPGHTVIVVDMADHPTYGKLMLLAQSYMPAQDIHILKNMRQPHLSPWFQVPSQGILATPEWTFKTKHLKKFE